jgi:hypothetical protein
MKTIAWNYTKNGIFSVKSAYHLRMQLNLNGIGREGSSRNIEEHKGWLAIWAAEVLVRRKFMCGGSFRTDLL